MMMGRLNSFCFILFVNICFTNALKLPSYLTPCSRSDPKLNECALKNGRLGVASLLKGDPKYHIPVLDPLDIPELLIDSSGQLTIRLTNSKVYGFDKAEILKLDLDLANHHIKATVAIPVLKIVGDYEISGRILVLPINGNGPCSLKAYDGIFTVRFNYTLVDRKGVKYGQMDASEVDYDMKKAEFQLENLFNNKQLSDQMNDLLNSNWRDVLKDIGPAITEAVSAIIKSIFSNLLDRVPYDDIFLP